MKFDGGAEVCWERCRSATLAGDEPPDEGLVGPTRAALLNGHGRGADQSASVAQGRPP